MRRGLVYVGIVLVFIGLAWLLLWWPTIQPHWLAVHTGTVNEAGPYYGFFSGFGSDIGEVTILGGVITIYRGHNCHTKGCWRVGVHTTPTGYKLCKKCVAKPKSTLTLHPIHPDHQ
jgi:hypothetical protein